MLPFSQFSDGDSWWKIMTSNPDTTYWMTIDHDNGLVVTDGLHIMVEKSEFESWHHRYAMHTISITDWY